MSCVNVQNILGFLVLFSLFQTVKTDCYKNKEQTFTNRLGETMGEHSNASSPIVAVSPITNNISNYFKLIENFELSSRRTEESEFRPQRKPRTVMNGTMGFGISCLSCSANIPSHHWNCFSGYSLSSKKCADAEQCYVEVNPTYIKRGCILPGRVNRTFLCKCPLCNDKPSFDTSHYEYKSLNDWSYDNSRLLKPEISVDLMCKVCETKGTNPNSDKHCRSGKNADYMVCPHNQLCYTNIDDESDFVSRGCTDKLIFNSIFFFCNNSGCNNARYPNPTENIHVRARALRLKDDKPRRKTLYNSGSKSCDTNLYLIFMILSKIIHISY